MSTSKVGKISEKFSVLSHSTNVLVVDKGSEVPDSAVGESEIAPEIRKKIEDEILKKSAEYESRIAVLKEEYEQQIKNLENEIAELKNENKSLKEDLPLLLSKYFKELENQIKDEICELSFFIAEIIIKDELSRKDAFRGVIKEALKNINVINNIKLYINPDYVERIKNSNEYGLPPGIEIISDNSLGAGEILLKTSQGIIDATVKERLKNLKEIFTNAIEEIKEKE